MKYIDYDWDLDPSSILFDDELDLDKLGWENGDYFKLIFTDDGKRILMKVEELEQFIIKGVENGCSRTD